MIDKRNNDDVIIADIVDDSVHNAEGFKPTLVFNSMHQSQQQNVAVDNTTVNNIFRSEMVGWKESLQKILTEFLLSFLEPDRFLKNAKAIFILLCAWTLKDFTPEEIKTLLVVIFK